MESRRFKLSEIALIAFSGALFAAAASLYFLDMSLRSVFLGAPKTLERVKIGFVQTKTGSLLLEPYGELDFRPVEEKDAISLNDTLVTNATSKARLELEDGTLIDLGANTIIKLSFETQMT